jgi:imidazolonepropionase-like amidohydrolase
MRIGGRLVFLASFVCGGALAQTPSHEVRKFIKFDQPVIALSNVRVIDGTGAPAQEHRTIIVRNGRIAAVTDAAVAPPAGAHVIDLAGRSVIPGLVGMHNHLMYTASINMDEDDKMRCPASSSPNSRSARRACTWPPA